MLETRPLTEPFRSHDSIHYFYQGHFRELYFVLLGGAGIGKSSSMRILASDWASSENQSNRCHRLDQFNFIFLIELGYVNDNSSLEKIIIKQHGLRGDCVTESQIRCILRGTDESRVLIILDGYDEYKKGTNEDIDAAIEDTIGDCFLILTP